MTSELLKEARRHDEAMTDGPWEVDEDRNEQPNIHAPGQPTDWIAILPTQCIGTIQDEQRINAAGIAWLRTNLAELIAGYTAALDEVERLRADHTETTNTYEERILELETASVTLRTSIGEQSLVIEQQDLDLTRLTDNLAAARDLNRHYEQERDSWPLAYRQRATKTDARIKELEGEVERMRTALATALIHWRYPPLDAEEKARKDEIWSLAHGTATTIKGAPCPDTTK